MSTVELKPMYYVSESVIEEHVRLELVMPAVEAMYVAMSQKTARNFPVVRERLGYADAVFGFKSGFDESTALLGVKAGGFWPGNRPRKLENHQSTVVLFDPETGAPRALVRGNRLTALRTAAASAISIKYLARSDAKTLGILGAGAQARLQIPAALRQRRFRRLLIVDQVRERAASLAGEFADGELEVDVCSAEAMVRDSDVVITITPSFAPVVEADWVRPGVHLACMGADTRGKQEIDPAILVRASVFCDELAQAISIGECQHAVGQGLLRPEDIGSIGEVIAGSRRGREGPDQVTVFDSTGVGLQDVVAANVALQVALDLGLARELDYAGSSARRGKRSEPGAHHEADRTGAQRPAGADP